MMKRFQADIAFVLSALLVFVFLFSAVTTNAAPQHGFSVKQYEEFHDVLHPLEHEALPKKDYRRIRANSALLVRRGQAIVRLGMPASMAEDQKEEFTKCLNTFSKALARFKTDARRGTNARLKNSYSAVHDSFEILASTLPRKNVGS